MSSSLRSSPVHANGSNHHSSKRKTTSSSSSSTNNNADTSVEDTNGKEVAVTSAKKTVKRFHSYDPIDYLSLPGVWNHKENLFNQQKKLEKELESFRKNKTSPLFVNFCKKEEKKNTDANANNEPFSTLSLDKKQTKYIEACEASLNHLQKLQTMISERHDDVMKVLDKLVAMNQADSSNPLIQVLMQNFISKSNTDTSSSSSTKDGGDDNEDDE